MGACPNQAEEEQQFAMTTTEALRLQLDNLQKEKHELQVRILKLSQTKPDAKAITEIETERDHWKEKYEGVVIETPNLRNFMKNYWSLQRALALLPVMRGPRAFLSFRNSCTRRWRLHNSGKIDVRDLIRSL